MTKQFGMAMQTNDGMVTIDEGGGLRNPLVKSRPIVSRFWLKGGQYRVTIPGEGWGQTTLDQCQVGEATGMIHYAHGRITIADRDGLEAAACECYAVIKREYVRLLGIGEDAQAGTKPLAYEEQPRNLSR